MDMLKAVRRRTVSIQTALGDTRARVEMALSRAHKLMLRRGRTWHMTRIEMLSVSPESRAEFEKIVESYCPGDGWFCGVRDYRRDTYGIWRARVVLVSPQHMVRIDDLPVDPEELQIRKAMEGGAA